MELQFSHIIDLARQYKIYADQPGEIYKALNVLPEPILEDIFKEYGDPENRFQPVNLLRAEAARQLLNGVELSEILVEAIKEKIRTKELTYFNHLPPAFLEELKNYPMAGKRDIFANWQKAWSVFHPFFYRLTGNKEKETVQNYLEQIAKDLLAKLGLTDYTLHTVDFQGTTNFGSTFCWIALYPITKYSHQDAYQFFVRLSTSPEAGRMSGHSLKDARADKLLKINSYAEVIKTLQNQKSEIIKLNRESRNYFKFAPGPQASEWGKFYEAGIAAVNYTSLNLGDISLITSWEQIKASAGFEKESQSNKIWNLWLFRTANIGDVVFATKGVNACIGIGIIEGDYYYEEQNEGYGHQRKVKWITDKVYQYKGDSLKGYKTLFRPDTFSPTKVWEFLLLEYVRMYPELKAVFEKYKLKYQSQTAEITDSVESETEAGEIYFWWLNANPKIWEINKYNEGQRKIYTTHNEKGNKRRIYKYFFDAKPGDLMIGYESSPSRQIKAIYEITNEVNF